MPTKPALLFEGTEVTFGELEELSRRLAGLLKSQGLSAASRVAVVSENRPEVLWIVLGALRSGIVPVPISPLLTARERHHLLSDSGAEVLFGAHEGDLPASLRGSWDLEDLSPMVEDLEPIDLADYTLGRPMHYTSGTTGKPKGVWVAPLSNATARDRSTAFAAEWGIGPEDVHIVCSPLGHSAPLRYSIRTLEAGGTVVLQPTFDAQATLAAIKEHRVTSTFMVPTHLERIFALGSTDHDVSSVRLLAHAGAPIRPQTKRRAIDFFPEGSVWEFYGSTEGGFTMASSEEWLEHPGTVGRAKPGAELFVTDEAGHSLGPGEVGQIWVRDPGADRFEYWRAPDKTAQAWRGQAFSVGDLGRLYEVGYLYLAGRSEDKIITGGVNVYPAEVELVLLEHPAVEEAVVYGVDHPDWGQEVRARVVVDGRLDPDSLRRWARERLAGYKTPRVIELVSELPRTHTGKIKRMEVGS